MKLTMLRSGATAVLAGLALTAGLVGPAGAAEEADTGLDQETVVPLVQPSIAYLTVTYQGYVWDKYLDGGQYLDDDNGDAVKFSATFQCSAFAVNSDGWLATAGHCVDPSDGVDAVAKAAAQWTQRTDYYSKTYAVDDLTEGFRVDTVDLDADKVLKNRAARTVQASWSKSLTGTTGEQELPARVIAFQRFEGGDAALLKVNVTGLNALPLAEGETPEINSQVVTAGYPGVIESYADHDLVPTFNPGTISSVKSIRGGLLTVLQLSAPLSGGMSGGPTVNLDGEVVGINSSGYAGEDINYAMPIDRLRELMNGAGVESEVAPVTEDYREGIRATVAGDKETAIELLSGVVEEQPGHELAAQYLAKAQDLPDPEPPAAAEEASLGLAPLAAMVVAAVILLLAVVALVVARHRRAARRSEATAPWNTPSTGWASHADVTGFPQPSYPTAAQRQPVGFHGQGVAPASAPTQPVMPVMPYSPAPHQAVPQPSTHPANRPVPATPPPGFHLATVQRPTTGGCPCGNTRASGRFCNACGGTLG